MAERISIDQLEKYLWDAAVSLRGQINANAYKDYIFPLVFLKRISDVYDEEYDGYVEEGGVEYADEMIKESPINIPDGCHWKDVFSVTEDIGQRLKEVFQTIENANPAQEIDGRLVAGLEGIFGDRTIWTNKTKMPDSIIRSLLNDFNKQTLSNSACPADEMGTGYEYLIGKFADDAGHTAQEFYTNRTVVELMAEILQLKPNESIYDPTCGSGGMLIKSLTYLKDKGEEWREVKVYGQELNAGTSAIARMNCYLHGIHEFSIVNADTLENPAFIENGKVKQFDVVLANPPYSISDWNREKFAHDKYGRCFLGVPPQSRADYAFIQHIIASMDEKTGRCAMLLPHGVLNRGEEKEMRINHINTDNIDAIIGLGRHLFFNSGLESFVFLCNNCKPKERKGKILFIEAEKCTHKQGPQAYLFEEDIKRIVHAYRNMDDEPGFSKWVNIEDIQDGNLNIKSYVKSIDPSEIQSVSDSFDELLESQSSLNEAIKKFELVDDNNEVSEVINNYQSLDKSNWKRVKLGDVATEYSKRIDNPSQSEYEFYIGSDCIGQYDFTINKRQPASAITSAQKEFRVGDYLLVRRSLYGSDFRERAPRANFDGCCSADILTIRAKEGIIADGYLIYILYSKGLWDYIVSNSSGGLTRRIKWKQIANYEFSLPPFPEQKALAEKLWAAYRLKQSYIKMIEATDEMVKSQFIEMFGTCYDPKVAVKKLGSVCDVQRGGSPRPISDYITDDPDGLNWIKIGDADDSMYITRTEEKIKQSGLRKTRQVYAGDLLLSNSMSFGRPYILAIDGCIHDGWLVLHFDQNKIHPVYLCSYLSQATTYSELSKLAAGGVVNNLNKEIVKVLPTLVPNIESQNQYVKIVEQADKSKFVGFKSQFIEMFDLNSDNSKWPIKHLPDLCTNLDSKRVPITSGSRNKGQYPYYGASGIVDYVNDYIFDQPILLISEDGANLTARVTPIAFSSTGKVWVNNHAHVVAFDDILVQEFVEYFLNLIDLTPYITGTAQPKLNQDKLNKIPIPCPDHALVNQFCEIKYQADKSKYISLNNQNNKIYHVAV